MQSVHHIRSLLRISAHARDGVASGADAQRTVPRCASTSHYRTTRPAALSRRGQSGLMKLSCWAQRGYEQMARDALLFTAVSSRS